MPVVPPIKILISKQQLSHSALIFRLIQVKQNYNTAFNAMQSFLKKKF